MEELCECPNCGDEHRVPDEVLAERARNDAVERSFHEFGDKLDLTEDRGVYVDLVDGGVWVSNGHMAVPCERVLHEIASARSANIASVLAPGKNVVKVEPDARGVFTDYPWPRPGLLFRTADGAVAGYLIGRYYAVLADCDEWQSAGPLEPFFAFKGGQLQGVVMPLRVEHSSGFKADEVVEPKP